MRRIFESHTRKFEYASALDVYLPMGVHENFRNGCILQERFEGAQTENFVQHLSADSLFFRAAEGNVRRTNQIVNDWLHLGARAHILKRDELFSVDFIQ